MSNKNTYSQSWELPHPPEKVWRALTEADLLSKWITTNDMKPIVGHKFTFRQPATPFWDGVIYSEVLEVIPNKRLSYTWTGGPNKPGFTIDTIVTWTLEPNGANTTLSIEHSGFDPAAKQAFGGAKAAWPEKVQVLDQLLKNQK